jgi:hypothetical protein
MGWRRTKTCVSALILCILVTVVNFLVFRTSETVTELTFTGWGPLPAPDEKHTHIPHYHMIRTREYNKLFETYLKKDPNELSKWAQERCSGLTQHQQVQPTSHYTPYQKTSIHIISKLLDLDCTALWTSILAKGEITGINKFWGFKNTHWGAITITINKSITALFKVRLTCSRLLQSSARANFYVVG